MYVAHVFINYENGLFEIRHYGGSFTLNHNVFGFQLHRSLIRGPDDFFTIFELKNETIQQIRRVQGLHPSNPKIVERKEFYSFGHCLHISTGDIQRYSVNSDSPRECKIKPLSELIKYDYYVKI
jgi:hypothetical protein